ncbi:MAG: hypothetical protein H8E27_15420 [Verrucomicrobia subdivision 3 bacterium]|nr:hypothetical protein [Limisphaerales bacterium]
MFCFLQRWNIDRALDEGDILAPRTKAHVARCADCRLHHEQQRAIVNRLEQSAQLPVPNAPAFLRHRVMNALRDEQSAPLPVRWGIAAWAPVAIVAAIAMAGILQTDPQPTPQPSPNPPMAEAPAAMPAMPTMNLQAALQNVPSQIAAPYNRELQHLQNDLKSAGKYLGDIVGYKLASSK